MTDLEIQSKYTYKDIREIAKKLDLTEDDLEVYGKYKAKITKKKGNKEGKLILVTSINPTPFGEGKTTLLIGINDALRKLGKNSVATLREPSLGPVFGIKGGATGGGYSQVVPMEDINLHFTGDFHAITSCNNLLCSIIDNHIYQGNTLNIDPDNIIFNRCLDVNDRALRNVRLDNRDEHFSITAASEIMAIFCLATDLMNLKERLNNILIGYTYDKKEVYVKDLGCADSLTILLKDAIKPNLVQTLEGNPAIIHGGPFANIAHGCNSIIATKLSLSLADYVVTEAGFGSDLGAEKFLDIKCRCGIKPDAIVINVTLKALKHNGYCPKEDISKESIDYIKKGLCNLDIHIENMLKYTSNVIIALNRYSTDTDKEVKFLEDYITSKGLLFSISEAYLKGSNGALDLASKLISLTEKDSNFKFLYDLNDSITNKITTICKEIYRADNVEFTSNALKTIDSIKNKNLPICIAKTQYSLSNDAKVLGKPSNYSITIDNIKLSSGAGFIIVYLGNIMVMPGLNKNPNCLNMYIDEDKLEGIF